ncbi:MAG: hypothetical protein GX494_06565 [Clostridiaceae bacterium]|nr:hypothetical protein [Clostridiaceae bacterium]
MSKNRNQEQNRNNNQENQKRKTNISNDQLGENMTEFSEDINANNSQKKKQNNR